MGVLRKAGVLAAVGSAALAGHASAVVPVGQVASNPGGACATNFDHVQTSISSDTSYVMPASGVLTSWSVRVGPGLGQRYEMKVFRQVSGLNYTAVGRSGSVALATNSVNTFPTSLPVRAGDWLGIHTTGAGNSDCLQAGVPGDAQASFMGDLADGSSGLFIGGGGNVRLNIAATLEPTNTFAVGAVTADKKKGTATVAVKAPNPGAILVSGTGVAGTTVAVAAEGDVSVPIAAAPPKLKKLKKKGKVSVTPTLTYTPTGGTATTQSPAVQLVKKKKKKKK